MKALVLTFLLSLSLSGCSTQVNDAFQSVLDFMGLLEETNLTILSNSTTSNQAQCEVGNTLELEVSLPVGTSKLWCRDMSQRSPDWAEGRVCEGGAYVKDIQPNETVVPCAQLTLCGMEPSAVQRISERADGGTIDKLVFSNLPWGCEIKLEYSFDESFAEDNLKVLSSIVVPPECPFCPRLNRATCNPCVDLGEDEEIVAGQVLNNSCTGAECLPCLIGDRQDDPPIPHGETLVHFRSPISQCGQANCNSNEHSTERLCNNGLWEGSANHQYTVCQDQVCGCTLPDHPDVTYAHNQTINVYKSISPACGITCASETKLVRCNNGTWEENDAAITTALLKQYPATNCSKRVCHCERAGRKTVEDGRSLPVWEIPVVDCKTRCSDKQGSVSCSEGNLTASDPRFLNFAADSCEQEFCGCRVDLADNKFFLLNDEATPPAKLYKYSANSLQVPDACTNPENSIEITCNDKVITSTDPNKPYDKNIFKYQNCTHTPLSCTFTDGSGAEFNVNHRSSLTISVSRSPNCGVNCSSRRIYCSDRKFYTNAAYQTEITAQDLAPYKEVGNCTRRDCSCTVNGYVIGFNQTDHEFYKIDKVTDCNENGCEENQASISCLPDPNDPGKSKTVLSNNQNPNDVPNDYGYKSCDVILCSCRLPNGSTIQSGQTVKLFKEIAPNCNDADACSNPDNFDTVKCTNGQLENYAENLFTTLTCSPPVCTCKYNGREVPFNDELVIYKEEEPQTVFCENISATIKCTQGGTWETINPQGIDLQDYPFTNCKDLRDSGMGGGTGGGGGNDEGPGFGFKKRMAGGGGGGGGGGPSICTSFQSCRKYGVSTPNITTERNPCILPWGNGEIEFYGSVTSFDTTCVSPPDTCAKHRIVRSCHFPTWTGNDSYRFPFCEEKAVCP